ncbi:MAG: VWA domain-containing protein [Verrucomicrobiota bacterium]
MTFLAPAVLAGAAAIVAPIAIHLLNKTRVKVVRWAAMRFLIDSLQRNQRRIQIEDLALLLLRCLLIVLLAIAFARLVLNPDGARESGAVGPVVAVLVLDQSASMGQSNGFQTRFDQAKSAAGKMLAEMGAGSQAALFLAGTHVNQVIPRPTSNLPLVRRALDVADITSGTSDLSAAIQLAVDALKPFSGTRKEVLVFSDNQESAWSDLAKVRQSLDESSDVHLKIVDPGQRTGEDNLAITALRADAAVLAAGRMTGFLVEVSNFGSSSVSRVRVTLSVDDGPPVDEAVLDTLDAGNSRTIRLNARFPAAGFYTLRAAIPPDRMPADNERSLAVRVTDRLNIAIVEGRANARTKDRRDAFFLANALVPVQPSQREEYYLKIEAVPLSWLQTADLSREGIVFLSSVPKPGSEASKNLEKYVHEGGSLVIFPGTDSHPEAFNEDPVLGPMMPAKIGPRKDLSGDGKSLAWQAAGYTHPVTALWSDPKNGNLGSVRVESYFPLTLPPAKEAATDARCIVKYADGTPAVVEAPYGKGRVVLFSSPANTESNNLPIHPDFVPLLQRLVAFLTPDKSGGSLVIGPGTVFQTRVSGDLANREIAVITPGTNRKPRSAGKVEETDGEAVIRYRNTENPGPYRFIAAGDNKTIAAFAVQMDPKESDLRMIPAEKLALVESSGDDAMAHGNPVKAVHPPRVRHEFWTLFVCAAFVVAFLEMILAHRFSFAK